MEIQSIGNVVQVEKTSSESAPPIVAAKPVADPIQAIGNSTQTVNQAPTPAQVTQAVKNINQLMQSLSQNVEFSIDDESKDTIVKVVDQQTKEVIRQIPTKEVIEISKALNKVQGLLIRQTA